MTLQKEVHHVRFGGQNFKRIAAAGGLRWYVHPPGDLERWVEVSDESFETLESAFIKLHD